jgi:GH43 family beta-xylosidase
MDDNTQHVLNIRIADTIDGIAAAKEYTLLDAGQGLIWAPEIHEVNGKLMIFFAWGETWDKVQSHVMVLTGDNALSANDWTEPVRIMKKDGETNLIDDGITLDMTCFAWKGKWYLAWAQRRINVAEVNTHGSSDIYISEFDPKNPGKLSGDTSVISRPKFGWERSMTEVDEGPFTLAYNGRLYMTIAANGTNRSYGIKLMTLTENGNPLNPKDWITKGYPILATAMNDSEPGPGHSSFTYDEDGAPVLVYHWGPAGKYRTTSVKKVHFNQNGEIMLNIPRGTQVKDEFKNVSVKVIVK